jgi:fructokinase
MNSSNFDSIMVFGEVLFDVFPDQSRTLGGAPFNVACHLNGFGLDPLFISRVGNDDPGREVRQNMESRSMSVSGLQADDNRKTGEVLVKIDNDEPSYEIKQGVAYDYIQSHDLERMDPGHSRILYHGTLAARKKVSANTLYDLAHNDNTSVFCDINFRDPWWSRELARDILSWTSYLKVNEDELRQVCSLEGIRETAGLESMAESLQSKRGLECLIVTLGSRGAMLYPANEEGIFAPSPKVRRLQDTVGAGDAFSSVFLLGIIKSWTWQVILERAVFFAARICENKGAIPDDRDFYQAIIKNWEQENGSKEE